MRPYRVSQIMGWFDALNAALGLWRWQKTQESLVKLAQYRIFICSWHCHDGPIVETITFYQEDFWRLVGKSETNNSDQSCLSVNRLEISRSLLQKESVLSGWRKTLTALGFHREKKHNLFIGLQHAIERKKTFCGDGCWKCSKSRLNACSKEVIARKKTAVLSDQTVARFDRMYRN